LAHVFGARDLRKVGVPAVAARGIFGTARLMARSTATGRADALLEPLAATALALGAALVVTRAQGVAGAAWLLVPLIWIAAAIIPTRLGGRPWAEIGVVPLRPARDGKIFLLAAATVFPLFFFTCWIWMHCGRAHFPGPVVTAWGPWVFYQLLYVAIPEELFFRGYVQGRLEQALSGAFPRGVATGGVIGLSALIFALVHWGVLGSAGGMWVFFPALVFGWLRARTGALWAPVAFHAAANVLLALFWRVMG
jgi:membrane protease YdiL (CAAX protease family)